MQIKRHDRSHLVELRDGSAWRIWPGDIPKTLQWRPTTEIDVADIDDEICSHALIDRSNGSRVRVISFTAQWPAAACAALPPPWLSSVPAIGFVQVWFSPAQGRFAENIFKPSAAHHEAAVDVTRPNHAVSYRRVRDDVTSVRTSRLTRKSAGPAHGCWRKSYVKHLRSTSLLAG